MDYIKIRFGDDFETGLERSVGNIFRSVSPVFSFSERIWRPQMDICETSEEIIILAEIAGVNKEDLEIEINTKAVRIQGKRYEVPRMENATYRLAEIQYGIFERTLFLPALIDTDKVSASYQDGFLKIRLIKKPREKVHKIPISDG